MLVKVVWEYYGVMYYDEEPLLLFSGGDYAMLEPIA